MRTLISLLTLTFSLLFNPVWTESSSAAEFRDLGRISMPDRGVFTGTVGQKIIYAGGWRKGAESTKEKGDVGEYLHTIRVLDRSAGGLLNEREIKTRLPQGLAFGTAVTLPDGMAILGGRNDAGASRQCYSLRWSKQSEDLELVQLPDLPFPIEEGAGDYYSGNLWLCGLNPDGDSVLLSLSDSALPGTNRTWQRHASPPGPGRLRSCAAVGNDSKGKALFLFGGVSRTGEPAEPTICAYHFDQGLWSTPKDEVPEEFVATGTTAFRSGTIHFLLVGGRTVWAYNTITNQMYRLAELPGESIDVRPVKLGEDIVLPLRCEEKGKANLVLLLPVEKRNLLGYLNLVLFVVYFLFLIWMGWSFLKRMKVANDFFKAGHRIPWWAVGISIYGTITSAITYITVPAKSFMTDWKLILLGAGPLLAVPILSRWYVPRISQFNFTSAYEYLEYRFHPFIRFFGSMTFIVFQISRIAILLFLPAIAFHSITGIDLNLCILVVGITGILCTLVGGIEIVIWIEVFQVIILLIGFVLTIMVIVFRYDGSFTEMLRIAYENGKLHCVEPSFNLRIDSIWTVLIASFFLYLIPYASDQSILQRYFTGKNTNDRQRGIWISAGLSIPNLILLFLLGSLFYVFYRSEPESLPVDLANNDALMPWFFITQLPDGISGILLLALMTSAISSVSSGINAISAAYTIDFHERLFRFSRENTVFVARVVTVVSGLLGVCGALVMATWDIASLWDQYNVFIGLISSGLAGLFLLGIFTTRANTPGIVIGIIVSAIVQFIFVCNGTVHFLLYSGTGVVVTIIIGYLASLVFPPNTKLNDTKEK